MPSNQTSVLDTPEGRVHINQSTGLPARFIGGGNTSRDPQGSDFYDTFGRLPDDTFGKVWVDVKWEDLTHDEQKLYRRQYPVV